MGKARTKCSAVKLDADDPKSWERAYCAGLNARLVPTLDNGLSPFVLTNFRTGERNLAGVQFRLRQKDRPVLLNFCPFCGVSFEAWLQPHLKKSAA